MIIDDIYTLPLRQGGYESQKRRKLWVLTCNEIKGQGGKLLYARRTQQRQYLPILASDSGGSTEAGTADLLSIYGTYETDGICIPYPVFAL